LDLAEAVHDGDADRVKDIVIEVNTAGEVIADGLARMTNLLLAYINVSVPIDKELIARTRRQIVNEEIGGITDEFGDR
jgi:hypothetical protein